MKNSKWFHFISLVCILFLLMVLLHTVLQYLYQNSIFNFFYIYLSFIQLNLTRSNWKNSTGLFQQIHDIFSFYFIHLKQCSKLKIKHVYQCSSIPGSRSWHKNSFGNFCWPEWNKDYSWDKFAFYYFHIILYNFSRKILVLHYWFQ